MSLTIWTHLLGALVLTVGTSSEKAMKPQLPPKPSVYTINTKTREYEVNNSINLHGRSPLNDVHKTSDDVYKSSTISFEETSTDVGNECSSFLHKSKKLSFVSSSKDENTLLVPYNMSLLDKSQKYSSVSNKQSLKPPLLPKPKFVSIPVGISSSVVNKHLSENKESNSMLIREDKETSVKKFVSPPTKSPVEKSLSKVKWKFSTTALCNSNFQNTQVDVNDGTKKIIEVTENSFLSMFSHAHNFKSEDISVSSNVDNVQKTEIISQNIMVCCTNNFDNVVNTDSSHDNSKIHRSSFNNEEVCWKFHESDAANERNKSENMLWDVNCNTPTKPAPDINILCDSAKNTEITFCENMCNDWQSINYDLLLQTNVQKHSWSSNDIDSIYHCEHCENLFHFCRFRKKKPKRRWSLCCGDLEPSLSANSQVLLPSSLRSEVKLSGVGKCINDNIYNRITLLKNSGSSHFYISNEKVSNVIPAFIEQDDNILQNCFIRNRKHKDSNDEIALQAYDIHDVNRPASGLSDVFESLDVDAKRDTHLSEDSFELEPHSDSENEDRFVTHSKKKGSKAFYIAQELMTSERIFVDVLKLLTVDFITAVKHAEDSYQLSIIPESELSKIINFLPQLKRFNEDFLHDLEERISNWNAHPKISDIIVKKGPFLKLYTTYIQNFQSQCNVLDDCCLRFPKFDKTVKEFEASTRCQKLTLKHYMLKPVQRLPQYRLLLDDYLHNLEKNSPDYEDTEMALKIVSEVAEHANRSMKIGDNFQKLLQLQSRLGEYEIIKPGREYLKDGELFKLSRKVMQPRYFILLNDCLLYTSYYGPSVPTLGLRVSCELPLSGMKISIPQADDYQNEFCVISKKRSFRLSARSAAERESWVNALQTAIKDYDSRQSTFKQKKYSQQSINDADFQLGREAPIWIQDQRVTRCQSCMKEFTVTFRRHHCRACGKVMCGSCSDNKAPLQYKKFHPSRVCNQCYSFLLEEFLNPRSSIHTEVKACMKSDEDILNFEREIKSRFKKSDVDSAKKKKYIPQRLLEVTANDTGSQMSGWLQRRVRNSWKRFWFVLKEQVLYAYKASEDVVALESIPILGYTVEKRNSQTHDEMDPKIMFQLTHSGKSPPLIFQTDSEHSASRWISAMQEATVLK